MLKRSAKCHGLGRELNRMNIQKFVISFAAAFFIIYGLAFSLFPAGMSLFVTGSQPQSVSAMVDFRATYGGMTTATGVALIYLHSINQSRPCLMIVILVLLCMAITRTLGLFSDGAGNLLMYLYLVLELLGSGLALYAIRGTASNP